MGGVETYLRDVASALAASGHTLTFWCEVDRPGDREPIRLPDDVPVICADELGTARAMTELRRWGPDLLFTHGLERPDTERQLLDVAPAVILAHNYYGTCISGAKTFKFPTTVPCQRRFGWPCLLHFYPRRCGGLSPVTMWREYRRQTARHDLLDDYAAIVTLSSHMREEYVRHGLSATQVYTVGDAPPVRGESGDGARPVPLAIEKPDGAWRLICAGRMDELKGGSYLIDALPMVVQTLGLPVHLTMAGDGPARARWERRAAWHRDRESRIGIDFPGWLDHEQLDERLRAADLLVLPSVWPEPFGLIGLEAMRHAVPVAAFAVGGVPDWLRPGVNGYLADGDPPTSHGLATAIAACLESRQTHAELRRGASRVSMDRAFREHVSTLITLFERVVGGHRASAP